VRRCLEPNPDRRYPSARALYEDLERQRQHLPLKHTREPSWRERLSKWLHRHPSLTSSTTVGMVAGVLLFLLALALALRRRPADQLEAAAARAPLRAEARAPRLLLAARTTDRVQHDEGTALARKALGRYAVPDNPAWRQRPAFAALAEPER